MNSGNPKDITSGIAAKFLARRARRVDWWRMSSILLFMTSAVLLVACGAGRPIKYYQLTIPGEAGTAAGANASQFILLVGNLQASHLYREDRIVYSNGGTQMGTYETQRWAQPPTEMVEEVILRELRASGRFRAVYAHRSNTTGDYLLRGRLYDFKEVSEGSIIGRCTFELELQDLKTGKSVWTHYYSHDEPAASKDVQAVVAALDKNVQLGAKSVLTNLEQFFSSHPAR
jgi:ABC-type uncharacterized transport system auxiliary subunit